MPAPIRPTGTAMNQAPFSPRLTELADVLLYERQLLEFLLFKLVSANLVLSADDRRFVPPAVAEVGRVMEEVRRVEEQRDLVVAALAGEWGTRAADISLEYLATNAPDELRSTFADHRSAFLELVGEIETLTNENRKLATVGLDGIRGTLSVMQGSKSEATYDAQGRPQAEQRLPSRLDRVL
jgi:hypothetical protein